MKHGDYMGPLTLRELVTTDRGINWLLIVALLLCVGFWAWIGYCVWRWWP